MYDDGLYIQQYYKYCVGINVGCLIFENKFADPAEYTLVATKTLRRIPNCIPVSPPNMVKERTDKNKKKRFIIISLLLLLYRVNIKVTPFIYICTDNDTVINVRKRY